VGAKFVCFLSIVKEYQRITFCENAKKKCIFLESVPIEIQEIHFAHATILKQVLVHCTMPLNTFSP